MYVNPTDGLTYLILCESSRAQDGDAYCETHGKWHSVNIASEPVEPGTWVNVLHP